MDNETQEERISNRIDYRKSFGTVSLIALGVILTVWIVIFFRELIISLQAYSIVNGIIGSPWVGFANFKEVFASMAFGRVLLNTVTFNLLFSAMVFGIALIMGCITITLPKSSIYRDILVILCIFPLFLSAEVYTGWLISLLGSNLFINPAAIRFLHPLFSSIKYAGIPIMLIYILDESHEEKDPLLSLKVAGLFSLVSLAMITNSCFSLTKAMYNPLVYESLDMIDTFMYRKGLLEAQMSVSSALGVIQTLISLLSVAALFIPIKLLFLGTFKKMKIKAVSENIVQKLVSSIIALVVFAAIYFLPYILNGQPFHIGVVRFPIVSPIVNYLVLSLLSALIATTLATIMSLSFVSPNKKVVLSAVIILSLLTILTARPINFSQYLMVKSMGFVNTDFAIILVTCFSTAAVWAMACILRNEDHFSTKAFSLAMVGVFLIQTAIIYCNSTPPTLYSHNLNLFLIFQSISSGMQNMGTVAERISLRNSTGLYGFILSLPSLLLFLTAKILLPKRQLISIISGGIKH